MTFEQVVSEDLGFDEVQSELFKRISSSTNKATEVLKNKLVASGDYNMAGLSTIDTDKDLRTFVLSGQITKDKIKDKPTAYQTLNSLTLPGNSQMFEIDSTHFDNAKAEVSNYDNPQSIMELQKALGVVPDGKPGKQTYTALANYNTVHGNYPQGITTSLKPFINKFLPSGMPSGSDKMLLDNGINTKERVAGFLSQIGHESDDFTKTEENLNYSGKRLFELFGKGNKYKNKVRFQTQAEADAVVAQGKSAIGDVIYGGRLGNNTSGDGYKYRGRGAIQLTGKANYQAFQNDMGSKLGVDVVANPDIVNTNKKVGLASAIWYWNKKGLNKEADKKDVQGMTKKINGGTIGLSDRQKRYNKIK